MKWMALVFCVVSAIAACSDSISVCSNASAESNDDAGSEGSADTLLDAGPTCDCRTPPSPCFGIDGKCVDGGCVYPIVNGAPCDDGDPCTILDACGNGKCGGVPKVCDSAPDDICVNATTLVTFDTIGQCSHGQCVYSEHALACQTCMNGACF